MKKFCSACGNQLELSQRFCNECGAVNPFFVSTFSLLSDQSDELEKLRLEKERIDKELAEKEEKQAEFIRQEQLRREAEETEKLKLERLEKERIAREQLELEKMENNLKEELLRVKEETIQHQKETIDLVKEVREELLQMEEGNKRIKEEIANLSKVRSMERMEAPLSTPEPVIVEKSSRERALIVSLLIILFGLTSALTYFYFADRHDDRPGEKPLAVKQEPLLIPADTMAMSTDTTSVKDSVTVSTDTVPAPTVAAIPATSSKAEPKTEKAIATKAETKIEKPLTEPAKPKSDFILSESKITGDMVGKKISGCDIIIGSAAEVEYVSNIALVDKTLSGNLKYKFTAIIVQGNETFTATPYIYYTAAGSFVKLDGTNCE